MDLPKLYLLETERERERERGTKTCGTEKSNFIPRQCLLQSSFYTRFRRLAEHASNS